MPDRWLALLPAAKTTRPGGAGPTWQRALETDPELADARRDLAHTIEHAAATYDEAQWNRLVEAEDQLADTARANARRLTASPTMPAGERYAGHVADRADTATLPADVARHIVFITATAGPVRATDPAPDERLAIGRSLDPHGNLATWWRPHIARWLETNTTSDAVLYDLLGTEYSRAIRPPAGRQLVAVRFETTSGRAAPSATAKQLRGLAARHLAQSDRAQDPDVAFDTFDVTVAGSHWHGPAHREDETLTIRAA